MNTDFNALNVKRKSIDQQYLQAIEEISKTSGKKGAYICEGSSLYKEVAEMLAQNGCDVKVTLRADDTLSTNYVFWGNAEDGRKGSIKYIEESKKEQPITEGLFHDAFLRRILNELSHSATTASSNPENISDDDVSSAQDDSSKYRILEFTVELDMGNSSDENEDDTEC